MKYEAYSVIQYPSSGNIRNLYYLLKYDQRWETKEEIVMVHISYNFHIAEIWEETRFKH